MSTDKLQALHNSLAEVLSQPPSPPTFFDAEPHEAAQAGKQASDNLRRGSDIPKESFGKLTHREDEISLMEMRDAHIVRDPRNESLRIARQELAEQTALDPSAQSDPQTTNVSKDRSAISPNRMPLGGWALRGIAGVLLAAGIGAAFVAWSRSSGDTAKTISSQPAPLAQAASTATVSPEMMPLLQSMARDLASAGKEIELLKTGRELMARENAKLNEQLKASQEALTRAVGQLSEQLKASQEQLVRDNANAAEQIKRIQDQLARVAEATEQNARLRTTAASPRPAAPATRKPVPSVLLPQAASQPKPERPGLSSVPRPSASAR